MIFAATEKKTRKEKEIMGKCGEVIVCFGCSRFLQGQETNQKEVAKIRDAMRNGSSYCGRILNYKKNGSPFWNLLTITPIKDDTGNTSKFIGLVSLLSLFFSFNCIVQIGLKISYLFFNFSFLCKLVWLNVELCLV